MNGLPFRSKLAPFEREIVELRRQRPPVSYRRIAELLKEQHGVEVTINAVFAFLRTRRKWDRRSVAECKASAPRVASQGSDPRRPVTPMVVTTRPDGNHGIAPRSKRFHYTFSSKYNLTRLTPEEKLALEKRLDEERGGQS